MQASLPRLVPKRFCRHPALVAAVLAVWLASVSPLAWAHQAEGASAGGFLSGLLHPLVGADHLLAMLAVGMWGAILGRPLLFALPVVFPLLMLAGAGLGILGVALPRVEWGIAISVVALGLAIALAWRAPIALALALVGIFGVFHGHAHGTELPTSADPAAYAAGFILATGLLHLAGVAIGTLWNRTAGRSVVRSSGALIGAAGIWFLAGALLAA